MRPTSKDLREILAPFELGNIEKISPQTTSGNLAFLIETSTRKYILRLCPPGNANNPRWRSKEEIEAELELIDYLLVNNFPAPTPLKKKDGKRIVSWKNQFGYLRKFERGEADLNPNLSRVRRFGELFGWFHSLVSGFKTKHKRLHTWGLENARKYFPENKKIILKSNFPNKEKFINRAEKILFLMNFPSYLPKGMIHEDLGRRHVLWEDDKIVCVIDFDRSYFGYLVLDLGQAIRGWCFIDDWAMWSQKNFQGLINSYQSKRVLTPLERKYLFQAIEFGILERAISFCLRAINRKTLTVENKENADFAQKSLFYLVDILDQRRKNINDFLKVK